jgi:hypothetical protein
MGQIFISYSRKDKDFVDRLIQDLEKNSFDIWVDRESIVGGERWRAMIVDAIRSCDSFLIVLSPQSVASDNVAKELSLAEKNKRRIIPVVYQDCEIPSQMDYQLAELQQVSVVGNYARGFRQLVRAMGARPVVPSIDSGMPNPQGFPAATPEQPVYPQQMPPNPLMQILPGTWQVQISTPMTGPIAQMTIELFPNGSFRGQMMSVMKISNIAGQWQLNPMNQLSLQGQETMGYQVGPYMTMIQFTQVTPVQLLALTSAGEQTFWQRVA